MQIQQRSSDGSAMHVWTVAPSDLPKVLQALKNLPIQTILGDPEVVTIAEKVAWRYAHAKVGAFFNVGDLVLYGKYKNKKGRIVQFTMNPKGQPVVEIEPIPKGRKQNKVMGLFKIWNLAVVEQSQQQQEKEAAVDPIAHQVALRFMTAADGGEPTDPNARWGEFNTKLAKLMQKLKKDAGAKSIAQNYKGTGGQAYRRQLWVNFNSGAVIDLWLDNGFIKFGGVVKRGVPGVDARQLPTVIKYGDKTPEQVYAEASKDLKDWAAPVEGKEASVSPIVQRVASRYNIVQKVAARVVEAGIAEGRSWEIDKVRIHRYRDHFNVTDLENAGKRGKVVRVMNIAPTYYYKGDHAAWMDRMGEALPDYPSYNGIKAFISDILVDAPGEISINESTVRGVDVAPAGSTKIRIKTQTGLEITSDPMDFLVKSTVPMSHPKTGEPIGTQDTLYYPANKKRDAKVFHNWLTANLGQVSRMTIGDFRKLWDDLKIPYDSH